MADKGETIDLGIAMILPTEQTLAAAMRLLESRDSSEDAKKVARCFLDQSKVIAETKAKLDKAFGSPPGTS